MQRPTLRFAGQFVKRSSMARRAVGSALDRQARRVIARSGLFAVDWYVAQAGLRFSTPSRALDHYVRKGRRAGLSPHPLYEPEWHLRNTKRTEQALREPFAIFLQQAGRSVISPHPLFDPQVWLDAQPAAARHPYGAFGHFCANATDETPLPLPPWLDGVSITWGQWRDISARQVATWRRHNELVTPPRLTDSFDHAAERGFRAEIIGRRARPTEDGAPLVTVITPVRNRAQQVLESIASVQAQTLRDWEMIIVDDGSTDATYDAVAEVAKRDTRVALVRIEPGGVGRARNEGLARAHGRYVAWLDSDNTWQPTFLATVIGGMQARNSRAAYAALEFRTAGLARYFQFPGGVEHLAVHNHVDLNVFVVDRSLLDEVGGFDESLRRAVDYDLIFRIAKRTRLDYLPFVGAVYQDEDLDPDRISVREPHSWNYVVRDRQVIDWERVAADIPARVPGRVSVVIATRNHWLETWHAVHSAVGEIAADVDVVVVDNASSRMNSLLTAAAEAIGPQVRVVRNVTNYNRGPGRNVGFAHSTGEFVVFLGDQVVAPAGWLGPLLEALRDPGTLAAQPLVLRPDGRIHSAGAVFPAHGTLPLQFLAGHPVEDVERLGPVMDPPALTGTVLALRAADVATLRGFDPLYVDALEDVDLCLRLRALRPGRFAVITSSAVSLPDPGSTKVTSGKTGPGRKASAAASGRGPGKRASVRAGPRGAAGKSSPRAASPRAAPGQPPGRKASPRAAARKAPRTAASVAPQDRPIFVDRWNWRTPGGAEALYERGGFAVAHYRTAESDEGDNGLATVRPVLVRRREQVTHGPATGLPALRWAVQAAEPAAAEDDGPLALAVHITSGLRRWGQDASVRRRCEEQVESDYLDDVVLVLDGDQITRPRPGRVNLLWLVGQPSEVPAADMRGFDVVLTKDGAWPGERTSASVVVEALDPAAAAHSPEDDPRVRRLVELAARLWKAES